MKGSPELLAQIDKLNIKIYALTSGKVIIGEVLQNLEDAVELNYASTIKMSNGNITLAPAAPGENVSTAAIVYSNHIEFESVATLRLKKYYLDYLSISKISAYTNENINKQPTVHQPLDPKGYAEDYWKKIVGRLLP